MEHFFTTYVRTKTVLQQRLKDLKDYGSVKVYLYELKKLGISGEIIYELKMKGEIWYDEKGLFRALNDGPVDLSLMRKTRKWDHLRAPLTALHLYMRSMLRLVTISLPHKELPVYFKTFLENRNDHLDLFFTVDGFSGRVHTPVVSLKGVFRAHLRLGGMKLCSLDVKQIQPLILAEILLENVGSNPFSDAVRAGRDIYNMLQENGKLSSRDDAKKMLFKLIFGYPMEGIGRVFKGNTDWVNWINWYKMVKEPSNPHGEEPHTNLAWKLQTQEVKMMTAVWNKLWAADIRFLTIHDDILVAVKDKDRVLSIMKEEIKQFVDKFEIVVNTK
jgi:hypothetical protein